MDEALQIEANKVPGCLSTVFVHASLDGDLVRYQGNSDAQLTKGLVALLVNGLSGCTTEQIERVQPEFIQAAGLATSLTPGRNNGFLNMLAMMKRQAAALAAANATPDDATPDDATPDVVTADDANSDAQPASRASPPQMLASAMGSSPLGPVGSRMANALEETFSPTSMRLVDESSQHAGHAGARGLDGESHFALHIVSEAFCGLRSLKRHQAVYQALGDDMKAIHALSIKALAPGEPGCELA